MQVTATIFIFAFMIYIQGISTINISHEETDNKLTKIPERSENTRMLNGNPIKNGEYKYAAIIYYPHYPNADFASPSVDLMCHGVLLAPLWVVTVAHCFDEVLLTMTNRRLKSNVFWKYKEVSTPDGTKGFALVGWNEAPDSGHYGALDEIHIPGRYDRRDMDVVNVDVALVRLREPVPSNIASPPAKIDSELADGSRVHPISQNCWTLSTGQKGLTDVNPMQKGWQARALRKSKVIVGNRLRCAALERKLHPGGKSETYPEEYVCSKTDDSVKPGGRPCFGDNGAALMCGHRLMGLMTGWRDEGKCDGENAYAVYTYLGHNYAYDWMSGTVSGKLVTQIYRSAGSDESASGLVEARKTMTWLLTVISVAVIVNA